MKLLYILFLILFIIPIQAQHKEAIKHYNQAIYDKGLNKIESVIQLLQKAIEIDPHYHLAQFELGKTYLHQKKYELALPLFLTIYQEDTSFTPVLIELIGDVYFGQNNYSEASVFYQKYINNIYVDLFRNPYVLIKLGNAEYSLNRKTAHFVKFENLGDGVNTTGEEYFPATNADESKLYYTRRKGTNLRDDEDIYVASYEKNQWTHAQPIKGNINTDENEGAHTISPSGKYLIFTACNRKNQFVQTNSCDIYISKQTGDNWATPNLMSSTINTSAWESQPTISADGKILFFTSNRPGGFGGLDLWFCELNEKGQFGEAFNAGSEINTKFDEEKPFFHPDGETFYFVSNGHPGYGGKDIFITKKINNIWLSPINLGKPFNSGDDESGIFINALGNKGYIASNRPEGKGGMDIYSFEVPELIKPKPVSFIKGKVTDLQNFPKAAKGSIVEYPSNKIYSTFSTDSTTGEYLATLPMGKTYLINVYKEGFLYQTEKFILPQKQGNEIIQNIQLTPIEKGKTIALKNTYFDTDKFVLKDESFVELDRLVEFMNLNPAILIEIGGHTDNTGGADKNKLLSQRRAEAVEVYLVKKGIDSYRTRAVGYGSEKPIAENTTEEGKAKNRRTEIVIR